MDDQENNQVVQSGDSVITKEFLETALRKGVEAQNLLVKSFTVTSGCDKGVNFVSLVFSVKVVSEIDSKEEIHHLVVKAEQKEGLVKEWSEQRADLFAKESHAYTRIFPAMIELQIDKGLEPVQPSFPMHIYSNPDESERMVVLKDLRPEGYVLSNKLEGLNEAECSLVMREIAIFHALGYSLKAMERDDFSVALREVQVPPAPDFYKCACRLSTMLIKQVTKDEKILSAVIKLDNLDLYGVTMELIQPTKPYAVICHGDLWVNNVLFRYDDSGENKVPVDVKLLDLQIIRYARPTMDLAYFFFTSTTRTMRKKNLSQLLALYYRHFNEHLERLNVEIPGPTFECFMEMFKQTALFGVIEALVFVPAVLCSDENALDLTKSEANIMEQLTSLTEQLFAKKENHFIIHERLVGAIEECVEMGIL